MATLKELKEKRASVYTQIDEMRKAYDGKEMSAEERTKWDTLLKDYDIADQRCNDQEKLDDIERRQTEERAKSDKETGKDAQKSEYREAFAEYLKNGASGVSQEARKVLESRTGLSGLSGAIVTPKTLADMIEVALKSYGGMFEAGTIINTANGGDLTLPTINDTTSKASIVAEYGQSTKSAPSFGSLVLKCYTYRTPIVPISRELMQDSAFNLDATLSALLAESFGRGINEHLTTGTGTSQPKGIVTAATDSGVTPAAAAITFDNMMDLVKAVDASYARTGRFMFNRNTLYALMKLKDATGRYVWQDSAKDGAPALLMGKGYVINDDMADIGKSATSVLFGDLSKYRIRMVKDFSVIRLNELLAEYLSVGLLGFARADGNLLDAGTHPVMKLTHAAS